MSKTLKLIFLGTNHFYDSPQSLIKIYHENTEHENKIIKPSGNILLTKSLRNNSIEIKLTEIKNYQDENKIIFFQEAHSVIIFFDLENSDSIEILTKMLTHLKENCGFDVTSSTLTLSSSCKKVYVLGKYQNSVEKSHLLTIEYMNNFLADFRIAYDYMEICTNDSKQLVSTIDFILMEMFESFQMLNKNEKMRGSNKKHTSGKCVIY
jgi:phospholipid N-methyltransferase